MDNDGMEDAITRAMRAADALDRETESLQPPGHDVDLAYKSTRRLRSRPRSLSWSVAEFTSQLQDGYPVVRIQSPPKRKRSKRTQWTDSRRSEGRDEQHSADQMISGDGGVVVAVGKKEVPQTPKRQNKTDNTTAWRVDVPIRTSSKDAPMMLTNSLDEKPQDPLLSLGNSSGSWDVEEGMKLDSASGNRLATPLPCVAHSCDLVLPFLDNTKTHFTDDLSDEPLQLETAQGLTLASPISIQEIVVNRSHASKSGPTHRVHNSLAGHPKPFLLPDSPDSILDSHLTLAQELEREPHSNLNSETFSMDKASSGSPQHVDLILAVGAEVSVPKTFVSSTLGRIEELGSKPSGESRSARLVMRHLNARAMQSFTALPLTKQMEDNPFTNRDLLAALIRPHIETYLANHDQTRFLVIEYSADHLSTVLALQALMGSRIFKVAGILNEDDHALTRSFSASTIIPWPASQEAGDHDGVDAETTKFPGPLTTSFAKANYLITASASDSEMTSFLASIRDTLVSASDFYLPDSSRHNDRKRRKVKPVSDRDGAEVRQISSSKSAGASYCSYHHHHHHQREQPQQHAFSSSSNLATPPISPNSDLILTKSTTLPTTTITTTTHLYHHHRPVSPASLEFTRASIGPVSPHRRGGGGGGGGGDQGSEILFKPVVVSRDSGADLHNNCNNNNNRETNSLHVNTRADSHRDTNYNNNILFFTDEKQEQQQQDNTQYTYTDSEDGYPSDDDDDEYEYDLYHGPIMALSRQYSLRRGRGPGVKGAARGAAGGEDRCGRKAMKLLGLE